MIIRITIVGCGAVAQRLYRKPLQQLQKARLVEVVALVDPVASHVAAMAGAFPQATTYDRLETALEKSPADLALILSPAHLHCAQTIDALRHGSHVLCEKPMAVTSSDCAQMTAAARQSDRLLAVGMIRRFFPAFAQFRQLVASGGLGSPVSFEYREGHKFEWDVTTPAAFRPRREGGTGVLFDIGPHVIDHLAWTFGPLRAVTYADDALGGIESNLSLAVESGACRGSVDLSWDYPQMNELRVVGSAGEAVLRIDRFDQFAIRTTTGFEAQTIEVAFPADASPLPAKRLTPRSYNDAMYCQLVQMIRAITLGEPVAVDGRSGEECVALLENALSLARPLEAPWLDAAQQEASRKLHWRRLA